MADGAHAAGDARSWLTFERLRWDSATPDCPHCRAVGRSRYLRPADGATRATRTGARSTRRVWRCGECRRQFSVLTGTALAGSRVPPSRWLALAAELCGGEAPVAGRDLAARLGVTPETARHMLAQLSRAAGHDVDGMASLTALLRSSGGDGAAAVIARRRGSRAGQRGPIASFGE